MKVNLGAINKSFLISNTLIYSTQALKLFFPLLILPFCINLIGIEKFGVVSVELSYVILLCFIIDFSVNVYGPSILASINIDERNIKIIRMTGLKFLIFGVLTLLILCLNLLTRDLLTTSFNIIFLCFAIGSIFDFNWVFLAEKSFAKLFFSQFIGIVFTLITCLILYKNNFPASIIVALLLSLPLLISSVISFILIDLPSRFNERKIPMKNFNLRLFIEEGMLHKKIFFSQIVSSLYTNSGPILLSFAKSPEIAGIWFIINRITSAVSAVSIVPYKSLFPDIVQVWAKNRYQINYNLNLSISLYCLISIFLYIVIFLYFNEVKNFFIGTSELPKKSIVLYMFFWTLAQLSGPVLTNYLIVKTHDNKLFFYNLSSVIILFTIFYPLTAFYSLNGWVLAMILSQSFITIGFIKVLTNNFK
jgi:O-antigen/teichoic acid export membrane protein